MVSTVGVAACEAHPVMTMSFQIGFAADPRQRKVKNAELPSIASVSTVRTRMPLLPRRLYHWMG